MCDHARNVSIRVYSKIRVLTLKTSAHISPKFWNSRAVHHFIIVMIKWTNLAPWEFEFPFPGSLTSTFLVRRPTSTYMSLATGPIVFRVCGLRVRVEGGLGFGVEGLGQTFLGFKVCGLGFRRA